MKHLGFAKVAACSALFVAALTSPTIRADEWNKRTLITFSDTVQVPGATLPAGTYVFKLVESNADRYIVQVFNERENHVYATILAIPDYHVTPPEKTLVSFYEAPAGQPLPVKYWFYPGDNYGRQFVYKKHEAALIAAAAKETVPSEETYGTATLKPTQTQAETKTKTETETATETAQSTVTEEPAPVVTAPAAEPQPAPVVKSEEVTTETTVTPEPANDQPIAAQPAPADQTTSLPSTGSEWPLAGLIGLISIAGALTMRSIRRRVN